MTRSTRAGLICVAGGSIAIAIGSLADLSSPATVPVLGGFAVVILGLALIARQPRHGQ